MRLLDDVELKNIFQSSFSELCHFESFIQCSKYIKEAGFAVFDEIRIIQASTILLSVFAANKEKKRVLLTCDV